MNIEHRRLKIEVEKQEELLRMHRVLRSMEGEKEELRAFSFAEHARVDSEIDPPS